jgi:hypothetical protein
MVGNINGTHASQTRATAQTLSATRLCLPPFVNLSSRHSRERRNSRFTLKDAMASGFAETLTQSSTEVAESSLKAAFIALRVCLLAVTNRRRTDHDGLFPLIPMSSCWRECMHVDSRVAVPSATRFVILLMS